MSAEDIVSNGGDAGAAGILILFLYGFIIGFHNICCYYAAKRLSFDTLNRRRLHLVVRNFVETVRCIAVLFLLIFKSLVYSIVSAGINTKCATDCSRGGSV